MNKQVEAIRQEIERLYDEANNYDDSRHYLGEILAFIDSLPEEKPSEDLEEAAEELFETIEIQEHENIFEDTFKKIFIAGAEWHEQQMMKDAVEAKIYGYDDGSFELIASWLDMPKESKFKDGDKVKIIIVKDDKGRND